MNTNLEEIIPHKDYKVVNPNNEETETWKGERISAFNKCYPKKILKLVPREKKSSTKNLEKQNNGN